MGFIWNILISFDNNELWEDDSDEPSKTCEPLDLINAWLPHGKLVDLVGPTYSEGGSIGLDANLYGGGFRDLDIDKFIDVVKGQNWKERSKVQLWVKGAVEGLAEKPFALVNLGGRRREAAFKAAATRKRRLAGVKAARTKKRREAGRKAAATRKANQTKKKRG